MELRLQGFTLRPWRPGDEASLVRHANDRRIWLGLRDRFPHPYTLRDARRWIARVRARRKPSTQPAIVADGLAVGGIRLTVQDDVHRRSAEIGYWLGRAFWGQGIMTEAVRAATAYGFRTFDLARIYAGVFEGNRASMRVLEKAGYRLEGRLRRHVTKAGRTLDEFVYAIVTRGTSARRPGPARFRGRGDREDESGRSRSAASRRRGRAASSR